PTAIASVLTSLSSGCVPGLLSVWELCDARLYSRILREELRVLLRDAAAGLLALTELIPQLEAQGGRGKELEERQREEILQTTGQVWRVCGRMIAVAGMGIAGVAAEKVDAWRALVEDAVEEIEGWDPDEEEEEEEGNSFGSDPSSPPNEQKKSAAVGGDNINSLANGKEHTDTPAPLLLDALHMHDTHALKAHALKPLKLLRMLYPALRKRRVSPFPPFSGTSDTASLPPETKIKTLDQLLAHLQAFSEETDEVAGSLYGGDAREIERRLRGLRGRAERCVDAVRLDWRGGEDEFSAWSGKWVARMRETGISRYLSTTNPPTGKNHLGIEAEKQQQ
ncbi:MAG: hypothetical protein Q9173_006083, partial [Seirophora scorigena]